MDSSSGCSTTSTAPTTRSERGETTSVPIPTSNPSCTHDSAGLESPRDLVDERIVISHPWQSSLLLRRHIRRLGLLPEVGSGEGRTAEPDALGAVHQNTERLAEDTAGRGVESVALLSEVEDEGAEHKDDGGKLLIGWVRPDEGGCKWGTYEEGEVESFTLGGVGHSNLTVRHELVRMHGIQQGSDSPSECSDVDLNHRNEASQ